MRSSVVSFCFMDVGSFCVLTVLFHQETCFFGRSERNGVDSVTGWATNAFKIWWTFDMLFGGKGFYGAGFCVRPQQCLRGNNPKSMWDSSQLCSLDKQSPHPQSSDRQDEKDCPSFELIDQIVNSALFCLLMVSLTMKKVVLIPFAKKNQKPSWTQMRECDLSKSKEHDSRTTMSQVFLPASVTASASILTLMPCSLLGLATVKWEWQQIIQFHCCA